MQETIELETQLKALQVEKQQLAEEVHNSENTLKFYDLQENILRLEREIAHGKGEEFARQIPWASPKCFVVAPFPILVASAYNAALVYPCSKRANRLNLDFAVGAIFNCQMIRQGSPNDEVIESHRLYGRGIEAGEGFIVENSEWINEWESINSLHPQFSPDTKHILSHYAFFFKDLTFECIAHRIDWHILKDSGRDEAIKYALNKIVP